MRLPESPQIAQPGADFDRRLYQSLFKLFRDIATKVNQMAAGTASGFDGAATAAPTTGTWAQGDRVRNSSPSELGAVGSKYVVIEFLCIAGGTPGTWVQVRALTGN